MRRRIVAAVSLLVVLLTVAVLASVMNWYQQVPWFDEATHAAVPFAAALVAALLLHRRVFAELPGHRLLHVLLTTCLVVTLGVVWEVAEWLYDLSQHGNVIMGKRDTMIDLVLDTAGALAGAIVGVALAPSRRQPA